MKADKHGVLSNFETSKIDTIKRQSYESELGLFNERLKLSLGEHSAKAFAQSLGLSVSGFYKYLKGESEPTRLILIAIADKANVNIEWLAKGVGLMRPTETSLVADPPPATFKITNLVGRQVDFTPSPELCHMPILDIHLSCGNGHAIPTDAVKAVFSATREWIRKELHANPEDLALVYADGDSMADTIQSEEVVIVDRSRTKTDGIWAFQYDEAIYIKRLQFFPGQKVQINSDNSRYQTYTIILDETFRLLGRVIAALPFRTL